MKRNLLYIFLYVSVVIIIIVCLIYALRPNLKFGRELEPSKDYLMINSFEDENSLVDEDDEISESFYALVDYATPEMFGAIGDGIVDDSDAINEMFDAGYSFVEFGKDKIYRVTKDVVINANICIDLNGSTLTSFDVSPKILNFKSKDTELYGYSGNGNIVIKNGIIDGLSVALFHGSDITIENIDFQYTNSTHTVQICACKNIIVEKCSFKGVKLSTASNPHYDIINIDPCDYTAFPLVPLGSPAFDGTECSYITVNNCLFSKGNRDGYGGFVAVGIHYTIDNGNRHNNIVVSNNTIIYAEGWGIRLNDCESSKVLNNWIVTNKYGIEVGKFTQEDDIEISGNVVCCNRESIYYPAITIGDCGVNGLVVESNIGYFIKDDFFIEKSDIIEYKN